MAEQQQSTTVPQVFTAIHNVLADIAKVGVAKNQTNTQQNFKFRGVDDVMDALSPLLAKHHLLILPSVADHNMTERATRSGGTALHALLKCNYKFVCPLDGSSEMIGPLYGEAMDSGDKSTNKAMSAAYKYLCTLGFCIPFTGDDPDAHSHEIAGTSNQQDNPSGLRAESPSASTPVARSSAVPAPPATAPGDKPEVPRPGGMFGYGKKYRDTPWDLMKARDLEFFLNGDFTPEIVRHKIVAEMAWREYELAQLDRVDEQIRKDREAPLDEEIP